MLNDAEFLLLSGIQHFAFCKRQWALIHIEQQWEENVRTIEGSYMHRQTDDAYLIGANSSKVTWRAIQLVSHQLGLIGRADVVELKKSDWGIQLAGRSGLWIPYPIEYKCGKPKPNDIDEVQLCAQAICLEEMLGVEIREGALYYGSTKRRSEVSLSPGLRNRVFMLANDMHELYNRGITPLPDFKPQCKSCSLYDICLPKSLAQSRSVKEYLNSGLL